MSRSPSHRRGRLAVSIATAALAVTLVAAGGVGAAGVLGADERAAPAQDENTSIEVVMGSPDVEQGEVAEITFEVEGDYPAEGDSFGLGLWQRGGDGYVMNATVPAEARTVYFDTSAAGQAGTDGNTTDGNETDGDDGNETDDANGNETDGADGNESDGSDVIWAEDADGNELDVTVEDETALEDGLPADVQINVDVGPDVQQARQDPDSTAFFNVVEEGATDDDGGESDGDDTDETGDEDDGETDDEDDGETADDGETDGAAGDDATTDENGDADDGDGDDGMPGFGVAAALLAVLAAVALAGLNRSS